METEEAGQEVGCFFGDVEPNAQATFEVGSKRKLVTFEMFKPKLSDSNQTLSFKVLGIGKKNKDLLAGLKNKPLSDVSLLVDTHHMCPRNIKLWATAPESVQTCTSAART